MTEMTPEWLSRQIVEGAPNGIIFADHDGIIRLWNAGAEAIFGYAEGEAVGQSLDIIIPDRLRPRHWEGYRQVMQTGETRYSRDLLAVPGIRKDGSRISLEFHVTLLRDETGRSLGVAAIMRDVTARWQKERELRERLAALESRTGSE